MVGTSVRPPQKPYGPAGTHSKHVHCAGMALQVLLAVHVCARRGPQARAPAPHPQAGPTCSCSSVLTMKTIPNTLKAHSLSGPLGAGVT